MPKTSTERSRDHRARVAEKNRPAVEAGQRLTRLLLDHPAKLAKFNFFMLQMNRELKDAPKP